MQDLDKAVYVWGAKWKCNKWLKTRSALHVNALLLQPLTEGLEKKRRKRNSQGQFCKTKNATKRERGGFKCLTKTLHNGSRLLTCTSNFLCDTRPPNLWPIVSLRTHHNFDSYYENIHYVTSKNHVIVWWSPYDNTDGPECHISYN